MLAFKINESITQPNIWKLSPIKLKEEREVTFTEINFSCLNVHCRVEIVTETVDEQHGIMRTQSRQLNARRSRWMVAYEGRPYFTCPLRRRIATRIVLTGSA